MRARASRRGPLRASATCALLAAIALCAPLAPAQAADVWVTDGALDIRDTIGEQNIVDFVPSGLNAYYVVDQAAALTPGPGCTAISAAVAYCKLVMSVRVDAGAGDDMIGLQDVTAPVEIQGQEGDDLLEGGAAPAVIDGGGGIDAVIGGAEVDLLSGGADDDLLSGGESDDRLSGNSGDDILGDVTGTGGADVLKGGSGADLMRGGAGADTLDGGSGDDVLVSGAGSDSVKTGPGDDKVFGDSTDEVACDSEDEVRGEGSETCGSAKPGSRVPTRWPPAQQSASAASATRLPQSVRAASASLPPSVRAASTSTVTLRTRGYARRFSVTIPAAQNRTVQIRVFLYGANGQPLGLSMVRSVRTRQSETLDVPAAQQGAHSAIMQRPA